MPNRPTRRLAAAALSLALPLGASSAAQDPPREGNAPGTDPLIAEVVEAHNRVREKEGLPPLKGAPKLEEAARAHAKDMAEHEKMAHEGSDGSTPAQRVERRGYRYVNTGENVAFGQPDARTVMDSWMNSPPHRANILGDFREIGVGRALDGEGRPYWSVSFGTPMPRLDPSEAAKDLVGRMNRVRQAADLPPLTVAPKLAEAAEAAARAAARRDALEAEAGAEGSPQKEVEARGYAYRQLSQSLSSGQPTAAALLRGLLQGAEGGKTLLGELPEVGVGYALSEKGTPYWCLLFASPLSSASTSPSPSPSPEPEPGTR